MRGESRARRYELLTEDVDQNSGLKDDENVSFASLVRALLRGVSRLERGDIHLQGKPTIR